MHRAVRSYTMTGLALAGAGLIAVVPATPAPTGLRTLDAAVTLTSVDSGIVAGIAGDLASLDPAAALSALADPSWAIDLGPLGNIVANLFFAVVNIPANFFTGMQEFAQAQFFGGPWVVPDAVNLWGFDPGDLPRVQAVTDMLLPFPALSHSLGQQIAGFMAAEVPTNVDCHNLLCLGFSDIAGTWFKVPWSQLTAGYTFPTGGPSVESHFGSAPWVEYDGNLHQGTLVNPDGQDVVPWAGSTFHLDLGQPFSNFFQSLLQPITAETLAPWPNVFKALGDFAWSFVVMFNPFLHGSWIGPGAEIVPTPDWDDIVGTGANDIAPNLAAGAADFLPDPG